MPWPDWLGPGSGFPSFLCVTAGVYREFLQKSGLGPRIFFELQRKPFEEMRWEEIWDAALRIRNLFLNQPVPPELEEALKTPTGEGLWKPAGGRPIIGDRGGFRRRLFCRTP